MWQVILAGLGAIILGIIVVILIGSSSFRSNFNTSAQEILSRNSLEQNIVTEAELASFPEPVQR
jgi:hypothetical protein